MPHKLFDFQPPFHETLGQHVAILLRLGRGEKLQTSPLPPTFSNLNNFSTFYVLLKYNISG